jgi:hypothetical protein
MDYHNQKVRKRRYYRFKFRFYLAKATAWKRFGYRRRRKFMTITRYLRRSI